MENARKKIIMVDDDQAVLTMGRVILRDIYDVFPVTSAAKLFEVLDKIIPDIILLDIKMPDVDGLETLKRLKEDMRYSRIPIIFVSSIGDDRSVFEHLSLGAYSTVSKPFSAPELLTRIYNCLNDFFPDENVKNEDDKKTVLVVDDSLKTLRMLYLLLREDYKVHTLSEPEKLSELISTAKPDLFILSDKMPALSGFDLIPVIRGFPGHQYTPILLMTGEKTAGSYNEAARFGVCDFLMKPIKLENLREKVAEYIEK